MRAPVLAWSLVLLGVGFGAAITVLDLANGQRQSPPIAAVTRQTGAL